MCMWYTHTAATDVAPDVRCVESARPSLKTLNYRVGDPVCYTRDLFIISP